jgi:Fe-S-cluster containining protein
MNMEEAQLISDKLGVNLQYFKSEYADPRWPFDQSILIRHQNGACSFLQINSEKKEALCRIHSFKPLCCREWESRMDRADCKEGLKSIWDLEIDDSGRVVGRSERVAEFTAFLRSIDSAESNIS